MDTVLGVSMAPEAVRMVLVEGGNADGVTVDEDTIRVVDGQSPETVRGPDQVISAILGTQEGAAANGYQLLSTGVTWTDPVEAAALHDALADRKMENVMLVSAFLAAAALAQEVGNATGYGHTALLFVEPDTATLAVVDTADGSVAEVRRQPLQNADPTAELAAMVTAADSLQTRPDGLFVVGSGVDIARIKPALEAATALAVSAPEEPETALARGAALASANAPLFSSSTAAMAYAQDPGTGAIDPMALAPRYIGAADAGGDGALAYSAVADDTGNAYTAVAPQDDVAAVAYPNFGADQPKRERRRLWLVASTVAAIFVVGVVALVIALALSIRPNVGTRPDPGHNVVAPANPAPAPNAPPPASPVPASAPAPAPQAPAPAPAAPAPAVPAPAPAAPPPAPAPAEPAPVPAAPAPALPPVVPVPVPGGGGPGIPGIPGGGGHGGGGPGGGIPGIPGGGHGGGGHGGGGHGGGGIPGIPGL